MADTTVKFFHSSMTGAPTLGGVAGNLISVLDACLVNGFGLKTLDSLVVASNVATGTVSSGHIYEVGSVVTIAGATPSGLNGQWKVTSVTTTAFTFDTTGISNQTATGTITSLLSPAGWTKSFSSTNLAAYKSSDLAATGCYLRVDDSGTTNARVVGYESMASINSGTNPFPTAAQQSGGLYLAKANNTTGTRPWILVADGRAFYLAVAYYTGYATAFVTYFFGDVVSYKSGDAFGCVITSYSADNAASAPPTGQADIGYGEKAVPTSTIGKYIARATSQIGAARPCALVGAGQVGSSASYSGYLGYGVAKYPNNADNGLFVCQTLVLADSGFRGAMPGLYHVPMDAAGFFNARDRIPGSGAMSGKSLLVITSGGQSYTGVFFTVDVTGPWR